MMEPASVLRRNQGVALATCVLGVWLLWLVASLASVSEYDGGILSSAATFVLHGQVPYRDFWLLYGPLGACLLAVPTAIFGPSIELLLVCGLVAAVLIACFSWNLLDRAGLGPISVLLAVAAGSAYLLVVDPGFGAWPLAVAMVLASYVVFRPDATRRRLFTTGVLLGLALLSRLDVGGYGLVALLLVYPRRWVLGGFALVALPAALAALALVPIGNLVEQLVWFPLVGPHQFRAISDPAVRYLGPAGLMSLALGWVPRLGVLIAAGLALRAIRRQRPLVVLVIFAVLCQLQTLGRADYPHFAEATSVAILAIGVALGLVDKPLRQFTLGAGVSMLALLAGVLNVSTTADLQGAARSGVELAAAQVRGLTCDKEGIFVGDGRNRYTFVNPMIIYYLADRPAASLYTMYNPGVTNREDVQLRVVADLARANTRVLLLDMSMSEYFEPENDSRIPGSTTLDSYIDHAYRRYADVGQFRIMIRDGASSECALTSSSPD